MYLNGFSVRVPGAQERNGYVELRHHTVFTLVLANDRHERADAYVELDGKAIGTWRVSNQHTIILEHPAHDSGRFTFLQADTPEGDAAGLIRGDPNLGLLKVVFTPEQRTPVPPLLTDPHHPFSQRVSQAGATGLSPRAYRAGGTGLSGTSTQTYGWAEAIAPDVSQQTTIHLRLVAVTSGTAVRPLTSYSTPVPPAV